MISVILFALALSSDAFVVSFSLATHSKRGLSLEIALKVAIIFGFFQFIMPLIGYLLTTRFSNSFSSYLPWVSFIILLILGINMWKESSKSVQEKNIHTQNIWILMALAFATSIDGLAAGITIDSFSINPYLAISTISIVTIAISLFGIYLGDRGGKFLGNYAQKLGAIIMIAMAFKAIF